jgi:hypothetical protein
MMPHTGKQQIETESLLLLLSSLFSLETFSAANATLFKSIKAHAKHLGSIILGQLEPVVLVFLYIAVKGSLFPQVLKQVKDILDN